MLLRNSISSTKKFFQKTLQNFKSFFSGDSYQRIPKTSPYNNPSSYDMNFVKTNFNSSKDMDKFYSDFNDRWDSDNNNNITGKAIKRKNKKTITSPPPPQPPQPLPPPEAKQEKDSPTVGSCMKFSTENTNHHHPAMDYQIQRREDYNYSHNNKVKGIKRLEKSNKRDEERSFMVAQKLKEIEMMDISNVDHVLDIEEVLHYYSRLTCPAYLDIVDKFFMDMYSEIFGPPSTPRCVNSRQLRLPSVRS